jgi:hypothetical protein
MTTQEMTRETLTSQKKKAGGGGGFFAIIVAFILGFFAYGQTLAGGLGVALLAILETLASFIGAIPVAGPFIYYFFVGQWTLNWTLSFTTLGATWLTSLIFWVGLAVSVGCSAAATFFLSKYLYRRFRGPTL